MKRVDINVDIGEGFQFDEDLLDYATSANVCCGEHAGSWVLSKDTIFLCRQKGVRTGMHPGFPDRENMGRARMTEDDVTQYANSIFEQVGRFKEYAPEVEYVKPHGAWYNMLTEPTHPEPALFQASKLILDGVLGSTQLPVMLLEGASFVDRVRQEGSQVIAEGFADRAYEPDGSLRSRSKAGAVLTENAEIANQVLRLARTVDSICIHGDSPGCVEIALLVYRTLEDNGYEVGY